MESTPVQLKKLLKISRPTRIKIATVESSRRVVAARRGTLYGAAIVTTGVMMAVLCPSVAQASAGPASVNLGNAARFSVLASAAATLPGSTLPGEVGAGTVITDDAGTKYGSILHAVNDAATVAALTDATTAYNTLAALAPTGTLTGDDLTGQEVFPGVYHRVAAFAMTTPVTFNAQGDPSAIFVMQSDAALNTTASSTMNLLNGAKASNIFWVVKGAATLGASSYFSGTILSAAAITVGAN